MPVRWVSCGAMHCLLHLNAFDTHNNKYLSNYILYILYKLKRENNLVVFYYNFFNLNFIYMLFMANVSYYYY